MGKAALIAVLAFGVMGTVYSLSGGQARHATDGRVAEYQHEVLARSAALAGLELAKQALADNFLTPPTALQGNYGNVPYQVTITQIGDVATVQSVGTATAADGTQLPFNIRAEYELKNNLLGGLASDAPLFMRYALLAEDELLLQGNVDVKIGAMGNEANKLNANVHSNTKLRAQGSVFIEGFGTSHGVVQVIGNAKFDPYNDTGDPATQGNVPRVEMPDMDAAEVVTATAGPLCYTLPESCANVRFDDAGLNITNQAQVADLQGTRDQPYIWVVRGGLLQITANVEIPGYVIFVAEDGFRIAGSVTIGETGYAAGDESSVAIYTPVGGDFDMTGNATFHGQVYAEGTVGINGNVDVYGSIASRQTIVIGGNVDIYYREASPALTRAWQDPETYIELVSYNEW